MSRRLELLNGKLRTPQQIIELVEHAEVDSLFQSLWYNYLMKAGSTTSATYWSDRFKDNVAFNKALFHLSKSGWIITNIIPGRNWGTLQLDPSKLLNWVTSEELLEIRKEFKFTKYMMTDSVSKISRLTKTPRGIKDVGLYRPGTMKAGNSKFKYDTKYLTKYYETIVLNTTKSIRKAIDEHNLKLDGADYKSLSEEIIQMHMYSPNKVMTLGNSLSDSRGRAISSSLSKVFNPIGYKDARALLIGPECSLKFKGREQVYLFIAELLGYKPETSEEKAKLGEIAYNKRIIHSLDLSKEDDRDNLYENIWLERLYDNLDIYDGHNWVVPIETDATASIIQVEGALLDSYDMWDETNAIGSRHLKDVWSKGMPRRQFKFASTPLLYGSTQPCTVLWKRKRISYTVEQVKLHEKELATGVLGIANDFKNYIIDNVEPKPKMNVTIDDETFVIYCNKYRNVGDYMKKYPVYDTASDCVLTINHTHTQKIADLEQFKRYFVTLLVHNRDSKLADDVCLAIDWILPIYDAFITMPNDAMIARIVYAEGLTKINHNRKNTLKNYFDSIGIKQTNGSVKQWNKLQERIGRRIKSQPAQITALK